MYDTYYRKKPTSKHEKARQDYITSCRALEVVLVQEPGSVQALNNTDQRFRVVALDKHGVRAFKRRGGLDRDVAKNPGDGKQFVHAFVSMRCFILCCESHAIHNVYNFVNP